VIVVTPRKILMTGATGFIGRTLLTMLATDGDACEITAVTRRTPPAARAGLSWIEADLGARDWTASLPDAPFDVVVHLAQSEYYREFPARTADIVAVNVEATVVLAEWASRHAVDRFLFASSGSVYGSSDRLHREDDPCRPDTMYASSKLAAEVLLQPFSSQMDVLALRLFGVYGPGQTNAILPNVISRFVAGEEITLAGGVGVRFNPIFIDECAALIRRLMSQPQAGFQVLNVCGSEVIDLADVVAILEAEAGRKANARVTTKAPVLLVGSTDRLHRTCEYPAAVPFRDGLVRTYRHARSAGVV
jgi:nucleoside-diphosphate-sugar epimerase